MGSLDKENLETLELFRCGVEQGVVTEEEFTRLKKAYETCSQCADIIREYEEKYGLMDAPAKNEK